MTGGAHEYGAARDGDGWPRCKVCWQAMPDDEVGDEVGDEDDEHAGG